jgi:hypothetical protein
MDGETVAPPYPLRLRMVGFTALSLRAIEKLDQSQKSETTRHNSDLTKEKGPGDGDGLAPTTACLLWGVSHSGEHTVVNAFNDQLWPTNYKS